LYFFSCLPEKVERNNQQPVLIFLYIFQTNPKHEKENNNNYILYGKEVVNLIKTAYLSQLYLALHGKQAVTSFFTVTKISHFQHIIIINPLRHFGTGVHTGSDFSNLPHTQLYSLMYFLCCVCFVFSLTADHFYGF